MWQRQTTSIVGKSEGQQHKMESSNVKSTQIDYSDKNQSDSRIDSGFLSGSNLFSSSSLADEHILSSNEIISQPQSPTGVSGCLDSGIDISEQLSSLQLCPQTTEDTLVVNAPSVVPSPRMSRSHLSLLREIFNPDQDGDTQLHVAVMRGFVEVVHEICCLLPHQAFLDLANNDGKTALHLAVATGCSAMARTLLVCGASPVARDTRGNTPLHIACATQSRDTLERLTRPVAPQEVQALRLNYRPVHVSGILAADLYNFTGETCIHMAVSAGDKDILGHLTSCGADINAKERLGGRTALHLAVEANDASLVSHLAVHCRASPHAINYARLTPYQLALACGSATLATLLMSLGAPALPLPALYMSDPSDDSSTDDEDYIDDREMDDPTPSWPTTMTVPLPSAPMVSVAPDTINSFYG